MDVLLLAALQSVAEVLPISASAHALAARIWLGLEHDPTPFLAAVRLAAAAAVIVLARQTLLAALGEALRAIARPALFRASPGARDAVLLALGSAVSLGVSASLRPYVTLWAEAPLAQGLGLVVSGAAIAGAALAPPAEERGESPSLLGMLVAGVAHGVGLAPGATGIGGALVVLIWLGLRPVRALELALALTVPALIVEGLQALGAPGIGVASFAVGLCVAFLGALGAGVVLRGLLERRFMAALSLWMIPLGLATTAYARALPGVASGEGLRGEVVAGAEKVGREEAAVAATGGEARSGAEGRRSLPVFASTGDPR
ncbi:undecaprenyl-diphosphate phosphatase [Chondromyces crocatus]|uniref:Undecaprenyl-diphosphatase n=1 Tax=Chondromyces crocatus TaxID=52 RepID=A0A0K1E842_CHOCO|nr:undecaprenyl-diphosphate phosphatase [Chondromyces crocatus]AKT37030.1 undecaprenol kinase [Chondromyces crocatus]